MPTDTERTEQPTEVSLSTSLKFWASDNKISDQALRGLIDILDSHGFENLDDIG